MSYLFSLAQSAYSAYALRALVVVAFWWFLARKRLPAAAMLQAIGFPLFGDFVIPIVPGTLAVSLGSVFGIVLGVEAIRQAFPRRLLYRSRSTTFVGLAMALFVVSVASYLVKGAEEFSDPVGALVNRFTSVTLPVCIVALTRTPRELSEAWHSGLIVSLIITITYLFSGLAGIAQGISGFELRSISVLNYGFVGGAYAAMWLLIISAYAPHATKRNSMQHGIIFGATLLIGPLLALLGSNRTLIALFPVAGALVALFGRRRDGSSTLGISLGFGAVVLFGCVVALLKPSTIGGVAGAYEVSKARFSGDYDAAEGSGRYEMWQRAWGMFLANPVLGGGEGNSGTLSTTWLEDERREHTFRVSAHGIYLKYLGEQGAIGGAILLALIGCFLANGLIGPRASYTRGVPRGVSGAFVLGLVGLAFGLLANETLFMFGAGLLAASASIEERAVRLRSPRLQLRNSSRNSLCSPS